MSASIIDNSSEDGEGGVPPSPAPSATAPSTPVAKSQQSNSNSNSNSNSVSSSSRITPRQLMMMGTPSVPPTPGGSVPSTPTMSARDRSPPATPLTPLSDLPTTFNDHPQSRRQRRPNRVPQELQEDDTDEPMDDDNNNNDDNDDDDDEQQPLLPDGDRTLIRGTDVHVPTAAAAFTDFLRHFTTLRHTTTTTTDSNDDDNDDDSIMSDVSENAQVPPEPFYMTKLRDILTTGTAVSEDQLTQSLDVDTIHLYYHSPACQTLYHQLVSYPAELVPLLDILVKRELARLAGPNQFVPPLQVRPYNLRQVSNLRCLDPVKMDSLIAIRGMIVRSSPIIPDLKVAHFSCCICGHDVQVTIDRGRIVEPMTCPQCHCRDSYTLLHNRCIFSDKQMVRLQETPDEVPAGQTPASVVTFCFDDLVDSCKPGDRVEVTGVLRAQPRRVNPKISKLLSVYKTYVDVIHFRRITGMENKGGKNTNHSNTNTHKTAASHESRTGMTVRFTPERVNELRALSQTSDIYDKLTSSLAPSIWELDDVKKGVLCMMFGGNHVRIKKGSAAAYAANATTATSTAAVTKEDGWSDNDDDDHNNNNSNQDNDASFGKSKLSKRGDINILLCGDPGTSKSQLLSYVNKLSSRGVYTSGKGSSAVGLTASVVRDPESRELVLESGALVLSDLGICCIDEFDKMSDTTRAILHEAMEQQTVSIAKAGIIATLNARTSVLASANPIESRYNPNLSVVENIKLPPTLLSRFDLIYLILDSPNVDHDRRLAQHLVGLYYETPNVVKPPLDQGLLRDYIEYAREHIHPELSDEATKDLIACYLEMRNSGNAGGNGTKTISATPRQLESLIRLSEGLAKMRYSTIVTQRDTREAARLMKVATQAAATDPRTGRIDMDMITTGRSTADREMEESLHVGLKELLASRRGTRMAVRDVLRALSEFTNLVEVAQDDIVHALRTMEADGWIQFNERAQTIFVRTVVSN